MSKYVLRMLIAICFAFALPFSYGGCSDGGGGGNGGGGGGGGDPGGIVIDSDDIGGNVSSNGSPEAGVWVIAETDEVITSERGAYTYRKIVVTDENGDFVIPDLPAATYDVWVRGYGLADSSPVQASPGELIELEAVLASSAAEAAEIYPANYWYSLLEPPSEDMFPGTGVEGNGIPETFLERRAWYSAIKRDQCMVCHQLGSKVTRSLPSPAAFDAGWMKAGRMNAGANNLGREVAMQVFGDWGARIASGEIPQSSPPRPQGIETNIVITQWNWGDGLTYAHDVVSTDKRDPTLYPYGKIWGGDIAGERIFGLDPVTNEIVEYTVPFLPGFTETPCDTVSPLDCFTLPAYGQISGPHNPMLDDKGLLWLTPTVKPGATAEDQPDFCLDMSRGDVALSAASPRGLAYFDTATEEFVVIQLCQGTHHLQFDKNGIIWPSGGGGSFAQLWFDPAKFDPSDPRGTEGMAQEWRESKVDSDGDGEADTRITGFQYGIIPNLADGTVWTALPGTGKFPYQILRFDPATEKFEIYEPPPPGADPRGIDTDTEGNVWTCLAGSTHVAKFERDKCARTWGLGDQCPEGWTLWEIPGPHFQTVPQEGGGTDAPYYTWVDQFDTLGLGKDTVVCTGTNSDSLIAFNPNTEEFSVFRTPYPLVMYTRGLDGRIDDSDAGWKGRGWWVGNNIDPVKHVLENDQLGWVQHIQLRSSPLDH